MIKKLHHSCSPESITDDLKNQGYKVLEVVNKLKWKTKEPLDMFLISFSCEEDVKKIFELKTVLGCKVEIETIKKAKLIAQCKRCQALRTHSKVLQYGTKMCEMCGKAFNKCLQKPNDATPKCVHCGEAHPASYRGCTVAIELQKIEMQLKKISQTLVRSQLVRFQLQNKMKKYQAGREVEVLLLSRIVYKHHEEMKYETERVQLSSVAVQTRSYKLIVAAIYCPPRHSIRKEEYIAVFETLGTKFILGGDFNAKNSCWGSRLTTPKGRELYKAIRDYGCEAISTGKQLTGLQIHEKFQTFIDFFLIKNVGFNYLSIEECFDLDSDHSPILLQLSETIIQKQVTVQSLLILILTGHAFNRC
ncbi:hypothetical protein LSTR_LSTR004271 [Laodelphax striatellus]|uniref:Pre-C2HC domain-containing protein n=1 Tax=Laodelphax striatellus TaxID=195883 RepID=A0A482WHS7_LAOST|nr:hypothetical protein LSTR_LSTR004271 [Laodelphax striatellus]